MKTTLIILFALTTISGFGQKKLALDGQNKAYLKRNEFYSLKVNGKVSIKDILELKGEFIDYPNVDYWAKELAPLGIPKNIATSLDFHPPIDGDTIVFHMTVDYQLENVKLDYSDWSSEKFWMGLDYIYIDDAGELVHQGYVPIQVGKMTREVFDGDINDDKEIQIRLEDTEVFVSIKHDKGLITSMFISFTFP